MKKLLLLTGTALLLSAMSFAQNASIQYSDYDLVKLVDYIKKLEQQTNLSYNRILSPDYAFTQNSPSILKKENAVYSENEIIELVGYIKSLEKMQNIAQNEQKMLVIAQNGAEIASQNSILKILE